MSSENWFGENCEIYLNMHIFEMIGLLRTFNKIMCVENLYVMK